MNSQTADVVVPDGPTDTVSCLRINPQGNMLAASSWDSTLKVWELGAGAGGGIAAVARLQSQDAEGPILSFDFSQDNASIVYGGASGKLYLWDLHSGQPAANIYQGADPTTAAAVHQPNVGIKTVRIMPQFSQFAVSASFDGKIIFTDFRAKRPVHTLNTDPATPVSGGRLSCMDAGGRCVVYASHKRATTFDMSAQRVIDNFELPFAHAPRCCSVYANGNGVLFGGVEGRVFVKPFPPAPEADKFAFKCHRHAQPGQPAPRAGSRTPLRDDCYPVNDICFHPSNMFATLGSDGCIITWDLVQRKRNAAMERFKLETNITSGVFHPQGNHLVYATGYDWNKGVKFHRPEVRPNIYIHTLTNEELRG